MVVRILSSRSPLIDGREAYLTQDGAPNIGLHSAGVATAEGGGL